MSGDKGYKNRRKWLILGSVGLLIIILFVSLMFLIFSEKKLPENAVIVSDELITGEIKNREMLQKINNLFEKEPALKDLPTVVEYFSDDYSDYTKYILTYVFDDSERGFYIIMKDYTGEGADVGINKLKEIGIDVSGLRFEYENLIDNNLNYRAGE
ncbi:hypothetical protein IKF23_04190 [Candidatus Saccharibacteria bacterium]|nr:hypothetical protein [Candidatus Saccharibacteria bacterium]